ncbi:MAG: hypothetical protein KAU28_02930 [Phycisphaerae bacterium]|nr:hypothetical protein [Phycisphaerae bacterium]
MSEQPDIRIRRHRSNLAVTLHKFLLAAEAFANSHRELDYPQVQLALGVLGYILPAGYALDALLKTVAPSDAPAGL